LVLFIEKPYREISENFEKKNFMKYGEFENTPTPYVCKKPMAKFMGNF
jgi:hypothetical protein